MTGILTAQAVVRVCVLLLVRLGEGLLAETATHVDAGRRPIKCHVLVFLAMTSCHVNEMLVYVLIVAHLGSILLLLLLVYHDR